MPLMRTSRPSAGLRLPPPAMAGRDRRGVRPRDELPGGRVAHGGVVGVLPLVFFRSRRLRPLRRVDAVPQLRRRARRRRRKRARAARARDRGDDARPAARTSSCGTRGSCSRTCLHKRHKVAMELRARHHGRNASGRRSTGRCATRCARPRRAASQTVHRRHRAARRDSTRCSRRTCATSARRSTACDSSARS